VAVEEVEAEEVGAGADLVAVQAVVGAERLVALVGGRIAGPPGTRPEAPRAATSASSAPNRKA